MSPESATATPSIDRGAAVTRSLLGWGVVAGPFYLVVGVTQAILVPGFDITKHALSLLMLGDLGWIQRTNLILSGLMVVAAAIGFARVILAGRGRSVGWLLGVYGVCLIASGIFPPDPSGGFPVGAEPATTASLSGLLHLAFGAVGFLCLAIAAAVAAGWFRARGQGGMAVASWIAAALIVIGFAGGAALATNSAGVALLWMAVVAGWAWLAAASVVAYRLSPNPVCD